MHACRVMREGTCGLGVSTNLLTCVHVLSQLHTHYSWSSWVDTHMPAYTSVSSYSLTAFTRLSALGICSISTKGWVKNSAKVIRASGFLSSSRNRRSLQSLDTLAPGGSWCTKHDLIMLHSIHRTIPEKRTDDCCQRPSSLTSLFSFNQKTTLKLCESLVNGPYADAIHLAHA